MNRSSGLFLLTGLFFLTRIGPFYPTLEWPFSPDPNTIMNIRRRDVQIGFFEKQLLYLW